MPREKITKKEIALAKKLHELGVRKEIKKYSWYLRDGEIHMCLVDELLPAEERVYLWTEADAMDWLKEKGWNAVEFIQRLKTQICEVTIIHDNFYENAVDSLEHVKESKGKTRKEAILKCIVEVKKGKKNE